MVITVCLRGCYLIIQGLATWAKSVWLLKSAAFLIAKSLITSSLAVDILCCRFSTARLPSVRHIDRTLFLFPGGYLTLREGGHLRAVPRQLRPEQHIRMDSPLRPRPCLLRCIVKLVDREVKVAIRARAQSIDPVDSRVSDKRAHAGVRGIVDDDGILLRVPKVNQSIRISLKPITRPLLRQARHAGLRADFTVRSLSPQQRSRDTIKITPARRPKEQRLSITAQRNPISAETKVLLRLPSHETVHGLAPDEGKELKLGVGARVAVEVAPGVPRGEVDDHQAIAAFGGGIGEVSDAGGVGGGEVGAEVEADVVEVGVAWRELGRVPWGTKERN